MKIKAALAAMVALGAVGIALAQDWGDDEGLVAGDPAFAPSRALCRQLRDRAPPAADRPDAATQAALAGCDAEALYYGIGMPADPVRARQCALTQIATHQDETLFSGGMMLMEIYANGRGAGRDLDLAIHYACGLDGAPMEMQGRITHLAGLKARGWTGDDFSFCEDVTSGLAAGYCAAHRARIDGAARDAALAALTARLTPPQRQAYAALETAREAYLDAHAQGEVDMSGTLRGAMSIGAEEAARTGFLDTMRRLAQGRIPAASFAEADAALNAAYAARRRELQAEPEGTVTWERVRDAQRAWLRYRDAFLAFAGTAYPAMPRDQLAAWLTTQRIAMLAPGQGLD